MDYVFAVTVGYSGDDLLKPLPRLSLIHAAVRDKVICKNKAKNWLL